MRVQPMRLAPLPSALSSATVAVGSVRKQERASSDIAQTIDRQPPPDGRTNSVKKPHPPETTSSQFRTVRVGSDDPDHRFPPNVVKTSIYSPISFVPKNLFKQFTRFSNVYFLFITALQLIPEVTSTPGFPTMVVPLVFINIVSAVRDLIEDLDRHRSDDLQNRARVAMLDLRTLRSPNDKSCESFVTSICADVRVGSLVRVAENEEVPADIVLIASSNTRGQCFVMTANLDGESILKPRYVPPELCVAPFGSECFSPEGELYANGIERLREFAIECEPPNRRIDRFEGTLKLTLSQAAEDALDLDIGRVLLKGTQLKDTRWAVGIVVYTGDDTKVRQNSSSTLMKQSWVYRFTNRVTLWVVMCQVVILIAAVIAEKSMVASESVLLNPFIDDDVKNVDTMDLVYLFLAYMLLFSNFVPISLQVTVDVTRFFQAKVIQSDPQMHCPRWGNTRRLTLPTLESKGTRPSNSKQTSVRVQSSELNEELGLIEHVFTDKTGTLTCNRMEFRSCHVDGTTFDFDEEHGILLPTPDEYRFATAHNSLSSFSAFDSQRRSQLSNNHEHSPSASSSLSALVTLISPAQSLQVRKFFINLAVNNSISPVLVGSKDNMEHPREFSGPSPDEKALVAAADRLNVTLIRRDHGHVTVDVEGQEIELQILHVFEFTSERKRSSIVCRHPDGKIVLYCKGADSVILRDLSAHNHEGKLQQAMDQMQVYSSSGLRVLCVAERELSEDEYASWKAQFQKLRMSSKQSRTRANLTNGPIESNTMNAMSSVVSALERDLMLVGITAIEDRIQEGVPETLEMLREAGIKVWMLTGDRPDTATNVAYAVRLISSEMRLIRLTESHWLESKSSALHFFERELKLAQGDAYIVTSSSLAGKALTKRVSLGSPASAPADTSAADESRLAVILNDTAVEAIRDYGLEREFLQLCMQCESVLCTRISPKQKEFIVNMVRVTFPNKVTMAVGDGANDVPMIQRAHIGIGIAGEEGCQASDASDYSIPAFRFLQRLVLVHGRSMNRRTAVLTLYIFYKNVLLVLPQFVYGIYCLYSGQSSYYDPLLQLFNICFTSLPVLFFAVFDQDISSSMLLQFPRLYQDGSTHAFLNLPLFVFWMFEATVASILIILIPAKLLPLAPWSGAGKDNDLWSLGLTQNFVVVFLANMRLLLEVSGNQRAMLALATASVLAWWAVVYVMSSSISCGREFYGVLRVGSLTHLALCSGLCAVLSLGVAWLPRIYEVIFTPQPRTICRELDYMGESTDREYLAKHNTTSVRDGDTSAVIVPT